MNTQRSCTAETSIRTRKSKNRELVSATSARRGARHRLGVAAITMLFCICFSLHGAILQKASISALKSTSGMADGDFAIVEGYYSLGDRGGGTFKYVSSSTESDDGGFIIQPSSNPGRWQRLLNVVSLIDATRLLADEGYDGQDPHITVTRPTKETGYVRVTKARAGSYYDSQASMRSSFLDIYVERMPGSWEPISLAQNLGDESWGAGGSEGDTQLLWPTNTMNNPLPGGCSALVCVTNSLTR